MLEREFSAQIGGPSTVRDEDITAKLPSHINEGFEAWNMSLHVQLSRLMARILNSVSLAALLLAKKRAYLLTCAAAVYGVGEEFDNSLVKNTQSILRNLAQISRNLTELLDTHFQGSVNKTSRMAFRLVLSYHHVNGSFGSSFSYLMFLVCCPYNTTTRYVCCARSYRTNSKSQQP